MATEEQPKPAGAATTEETTVGNYFISNYPPYSCWTAEHAGDAYAALARAPRPGNPLGLYVHIPFCRKRCHFCYFRVYTDKDSLQIKAYLDSALKELALYAKQPALRGRKPNFVYFGGGTPSYLSVDQLRTLTDGIKALFPWDEAQEVAFEAEPGTLTEAKLQAIRGLGVTRLSLGVEHWDDHVLEINGRAHRSKEILRAYDWARAAGYPQINVDLIAGMVEETEEKWFETVRRTIAIAPDSVTIYQMEVPYNTDIYKEMKAQGRLAAPVATWPTKRAWVAHAFSEFEKAGYTVTSAYTVVRDPAKTKFVYRDRLWTGADLCSLGVASFSHVNGTHYQNLPDFETYLSALRDDKLPLWRALTPTDEERAIRELILQLKLGRVSVPYFREKFGLEIATRFREAFEMLRSRGHLAAEGEEIRLTRNALLQVDSLLPAFFLPQHRQVRYT